VHDVFSEIFFFGGETKDEEDKAESGWDKGGVVGRAGEDESGKTQKDVGEGEADGEVGHDVRVGDFRL